MGDPPVAWGPGDGGGTELTGEPVDLCLRASMASSLSTITLLNRSSSWFLLAQLAGLAGQGLFNLLPVR